MATLETSSRNRLPYENLTHFIILNDSHWHYFFTVIASHSVSNYPPAALIGKYFFADCLSFLFHGRNLTLAKNTQGHTNLYCTPGISPIPTAFRYPTSVLTMQSYYRGLPSGMHDTKLTWEFLANHRGIEHSTQGRCPWQLSVVHPAEAPGSNNHGQCVNKNISFSQPCSMSRKILFACCAHLGELSLGHPELKVRITSISYICQFQLHSMTFGICNIPRKGLLSINDARDYYERDKGSNGVPCGRTGWSVDHWLIHATLYCIGWRADLNLDQIRQEQDVGLYAEGYKRDTALDCPSVTSWDLVGATS